MTFKRCSAKDCFSNRTPCPVASLFKFPRDLDRCAAWVKNSGNEKLLLTPARKLCVRSYLCVDHFEDDQFFDKFRRRLKRNAIPTIFPAKPLCDELMSKFHLNEDPVNALDNEVSRTSFNNKYKFFPLPCTRENCIKSDTLSRKPSIPQSVKSMETKCKSSEAETDPCTLLDNFIQFFQEEQYNSQTTIRIPSSELSTNNGLNVMSGPGSVTYIEGPWSKKTGVDEPFSVRTFDTASHVSKELLVGGSHVECGGDNRYQDISVHHIDVETDKNYPNLLCETMPIPTSTSTPCDITEDITNLASNYVHCSEFPIEPNQMSQDIECIFPSSSPISQTHFVIQSKQLTNGGKVCVAESRLF